MAHYDGLAHPEQGAPAQSGRDAGRRPALEPRKRCATSLPSPPGVWCRARPRLRHRHLQAGRPLLLQAGVRAALLGVRARARHPRRLRPRDWGGGVHHRGRPALAGDRGAASIPCHTGAHGHLREGVWTADEERAGGVAAPGFLRLSLEDETLGVTSPPPCRPRLDYARSSLAELRGQGQLCVARMVERVLVPGAVDERGRRAFTVGDWEQRYAISIVDPARPGQPRPVALLDHRIVLPTPTICGHGTSRRWPGWTNSTIAAAIPAQPPASRIEAPSSSPSSWSEHVRTCLQNYCYTSMERACTNMFAKLKLDFFSRKVTPYSLRPIICRLYVVYSD